MMPWQMSAGATRAGPIVTATTVALLPVAVGLHVEVNAAPVHEEGLSSATSPYVYESPSSVKRRVAAEFQSALLAGDDATAAFGSSPMQASSDRLARSDMRSTSSHDVRSTASTVVLSPGSARSQAPVSAAAAPVQRELVLATGATRAASAGDIRHNPLGKTVTLDRRAASEPVTSSKSTAVLSSEADVDKSAMASGRGSAALPVPPSHATSAQQQWTALGGTLATAAGAKPKPKAKADRGRLLDDID